MDYTATIYAGLNMAEGRELIAVGGKSNGRRVKGCEFVCKRGSLRWIWWISRLESLDATILIIKETLGGNGHLDGDAVLHAQVRWIIPIL